ncbi:TrbI F-type domain-containing protein [Vibrio owensii]|uniref:TrbI F-type domain-containing protein n=1 Tax=Vibrio owensii TaxID=696485 RepID=UPI003AAE4405
MSKYDFPLAIGVSLVMLFLTVAALYIFTPPQVVVFDIEQTLDSYQDKLMEAKLSEDEHRQRLAVFDAALRDTLEAYAEEHNVVIVVPGAVIAGAPNQTMALQRHVIDTLKAPQS